MPENLSNICSLREGNITGASLWRLEGEIFLILPRLILFLSTTKVTKINLIIIYCKVREKGRVQRTPRWHHLKIAERKLPSFRRGWGRFLLGRHPLLRRGLGRLLFTCLLISISMKSVFLKIRSLRERKKNTPWRGFYNLTLPLLLVCKNCVKDLPRIFIL